MDRRPRSPGHARSGAIRFAAIPLLFAVASLAAVPRFAPAQPVTERTPNLPGPWVTSPWNLHFQFAHRFRMTGRDADISDLFGDSKVVNYPTFDVALGLPAGTMAGVRYSSNSLVVGNVNEWQPYLKWAPVRGADDGEISLAATAAWNGAAQSADGELTARTQAGPFFFLGAVRGYSDVFDQPADVSDEALALAGGVGVRLNRYLALTADIGDLVAGPEAPAGWSAGLQVGIPYTPHTLSLQATNVYSGTLQGTVTGDPSSTFWGFEFTVPFSGLARWGRIFGEDGEENGGAGGEGERVDAPAGRLVEVPISSFSFEASNVRVVPGATVRWVNRDPVAHTSTSDEGVWDSELIGPGETYTRTFREPGRYPYHCTPHPFMTGVIIVTPDAEDTDV